MIWTLFSAIVLIVLILIIINPSIEINMHLVADKTDISLVIILFGFIRIPLNINKKVVKRKTFSNRKIKKERREKRRFFLFLLRHTNDIFKVLRKRVILDNFFLNSEVGLDDAFLTAYFYGTIWNIVSVVLLVFNAACKVKRQYISISPDFNKKILSIEISCIFSVQYVNTIYLGAYFLSKYLSFRHEKVL